MSKTRAHKSRYRGTNGENPYGRYTRHIGGAVESAGRTLEDQLAYLDKMGFTAKKERAKIAKRIERGAPDRQGA